MNNFVSSGKSAPFTAPQGGVVSGSLYLIGSLIVIAAASAAAGARFTGYLRGIYKVKKASGAAWTEGLALYLDVQNKQLTTDSNGGTNPAAGYAVADVASDATEGEALIAQLNDPDEILSVTGEITTEELLALNAAPKTLIAAPGEGKFIQVEFLELFLDYNSAAYDGIAGGEDLQLQYATGNTAIATVETTGFLDQTSDQRRVVAGHGTAAAPGVNDAVELALLAGEIATGDSPLKYRVGYRVVSALT